MTTQQQKEQAINQAFPVKTVIYELPTQKKLNISHTAYPTISNIFTLSDWDRLKIFNPLLYKKLKSDLKKKKN